MEKLLDAARPVHNDPVCDPCQKKNKAGDIDDMIFDGEDWHCSER